jgi:hypothetical protein
VQRLRASPGGPVQDTRRLSSDVAFVRVPGTALPWWLLRANPATGLERARAIADEGARCSPSAS